MASAYVARTDATRRKLRRIERWIRHGPPAGEPSGWPGLGADREDVKRATNPLREWATLILARLPKGEADEWLTQWSPALTEAARKWALLNPPDSNPGQSESPSRARRDAS